MNSFSLAFRKITAKKKKKYNFDSDYGVGKRDNLVFLLFCGILGIGGMLLWFFVDDLNVN